VQDVFRQWLETHYPDRATKVVAQVAHAHGGNMNDSTYGRRMRGEGAFAESIRRTFEVFRRRYFANREMPPMDRTLFQRLQQGQLDLFHPVTGAL
jgi:DNA repair photolyase